MNILNYFIKNFVNYFMRLKLFKIILYNNI